MKILKLLSYYLMILLPLIGIAYLMMNQVEMSVLLLFIYVLIYRPFTDAWRLLDKKVISRQNLLKHYPYWRLKWLRDLYCL